MVAMGNEEWNEEDIKEFTSLVEDSEKSWKPANEKLEVINLGNEQEKKELKIGNLVTTKEIDKLVANVVVVPKKDGKIRVCVDYRDLNKASPKDYFPLPHIDILVDNATRNTIYSFMDGFSAYNQIKMAEEDKEKTTFVTPWGTFYYKVYVDDILAKSKNEEDHLQDNDCQEAFDKIKRYLQNPPLLVPPTPGRPLILYLTVTEKAMGCVLRQHDESGRKQQAIYYLSKKFNDYESKYTTIERKAVKGSVIADHLVDHAMENYEPLNFDLPDEDVIVIKDGGRESNTWTLYFDGAVNVSGNRARVVVIFLENKQYPISARLLFECTNNTVEYEACIIGLEVTSELKAKKLEVFGDSLLIICQVKGPINPKASTGHRFILVAIDYFTKWVEANSYAHLIDKLCTKWKIKHLNSSLYRPKMNEAVEAANKNLKKIIQKMVVTYKDWNEMLPNALHAYRTTVRTSTNANPYSLVYGMEAVMPLEVEIPSLRI
ncbi:uncharacterized protein [Populus alba]|uniref:uncharacterized protein n=1 Tax=Populus alba TaxID=43335 RepID=UPI003CC7189B